MLFWLTVTLAIFIGVLAGTLTGIIPGLHVNLLSAILLSASGLILAQTSPIIVVVFIVAMSTAHIFVNYIPSIFLGAPDEDNFLSVLPGHELLLEGKAYDAIVYSLYGCIMGTILIIVFSPLFYFYLPPLYSYAERIMPVILIVSSFFLVYFEKSSRLWAFLIFIFSGIIGLATFTLPIKESLLPLFTGLFGISSMITSVTKKQKIPKQTINSLKSIALSKKSIVKSTIASAIASPLCSFLPGMGSGQAAVIGSEISGEMDRKEFLILLGSINTLVTGLSFITLYSIGKARTGVAASIGKLMELDIPSIKIITLAIISSSILAFFITLFVSRIFSKIISKINYPIISFILIIFLIGINFYFSSWLGLLVLGVSTILGLLCIYSGVRRTHMLGSLIIPAIMLYLL